MGRPVRGGRDEECCPVALALCAGGCAVAVSCAVVFSWLSVDFRPCLCCYVSNFLLELACLDPALCSGGLVGGV